MAKWWEHMGKYRNMMEHMGKYMGNIWENHGKMTRSILDGYKLILTSLLVWEYLLISKEFVMFCRVSKIGNDKA